MADIDMGQVRMSDEELEQKVKDIVGTTGGGGGGIDVLWTNPSPQAVFGTQTVTLDKSLSDYRFISVVWNLYAVSTYDPIILSSGLYPLSEKAYSFRYVDFYVGQGIIWRNVMVKDDTSITFGNVSKVSAFPGSSTSTLTNSLYLVPYIILGYK